jgi:hypothetical protein
MLYPNEN